MGNAIRYAKPTAPANPTHAALAKCWTNQPKAVILEMHSNATMRENAAMYRALCEGTLGRAFQMFHASDPSGAMRVMRFALVWWSVSLYNPTARAKEGISDIPGEPIGIGAFAHILTENVGEMAEAHIPFMVNHFGHVAWQRDAWEWFASTVCKERN